MRSETGRVIESLLRGQFICKISDEAGWELLSNESKRQQVNDHLAVLNRQVSSAASDTVYYASYQDLGEEERDVLGHQFQDVVQSLQPLVQWMVLVQEAGSGDEPLAQGVRVRLNELQTTIEDVPALSEQLSKIARFRLFNSTSTSVEGQLKQIFKRLCELGYLVRPNAEKQIYQATGKIEYLYEVLRFIDETESLALEQKAEVMKQENLL
ncbi:conserved hypothetical protein [Ferrimonas balearica DSM 9799]|uniref:Uncharacterized protein n=1 Tax=Ferrimonas balearica (strain DSM 9799 / CCM 4581 / KCTC 23876 / PAT) TaxID=550540 RepID=E1SQN8_FERBD|nr:hypothetical protein [Ferrimonas balearica]ADN75836.1 conserved hypothetical protein [Ferrimonas balearica DSM 9799]